MYDSRIDWRRPGRDHLDPELENIVASSLIEVSRPHRYALAAFQVGTACIIAGALLILLAVYGSTVWNTSTMPENVPGLLTTAVVGIALSIVGALTAILSAFHLKFGRRV